MFVNVTSLLVLSGSIFGPRVSVRILAHGSDLESLIIFMSLKLCFQAAGCFIFSGLFLHLEGHKRIAVGTDIPLPPHTRKGLTDFIFACG